MFLEDVFSFIAFFCVTLSLLLQPNVTSDNSEAPAMESVLSASLKTDGNSSLPKPITTTEMPLPVPEVKESNSFPSAKKVPSQSTSRQPSDLSSSLERFDLEFHSTNSLPKQSPPESQTPLPVVLSESLLAKGSEHNVSQAEESLLQLNTNYELDYVTRTAGTLYHVSNIHSL